MSEIPKTMLSAILVEQNRPLVIEEVTLPDQLNFGQVLVKVFYSGICGSQLGEIDGVKGADPWLPHLLGHEGSGEVLAVGAGVSCVSPGDHVVLHWMEGAGLSGPPPRYRWRDKPCNAGGVTTFNQYAVVSENRLTAIPQDFDLKLAPLFGCAVTTGLGLVNNKARLKFGESLVVMGAGGVGLNVIQGAAMASADPIVAVDLFDAKLELARKFGASHIINSANADPQKEIPAIIGGSGADVVVDNTGNPKIIEMAYNLTAATGRTILVGVPKKGINVSIYSLPLHFGKQLTGTRGGESMPANDIPRYIKLYKSGKLKLDGLITDRFNLTEINVAIGLIGDGKIAGRCVIEMFR